MMEKNKLFEKRDALKSELGKIEEEIKARKKIDREKIKKLVEEYQKNYRDDEIFY